jgi:hypothetical protein
MKYLSKFVLLAVVVVVVDAAAELPPCSEYKGCEAPLTTYANPDPGGYCYQLGTVLLATGGKRKIGEQVCIGEESSEVPVGTDELKQKHRSQVVNLTERIKSLEEDLDQLKAARIDDPFTEEAFNNLKDHFVFEAERVRDEHDETIANLLGYTKEEWNEYSPVIAGDGHGREVMCLVVPARTGGSNAQVSWSQEDRPHSHGLMDKDFRWAVKDCEVKDGWQDGGDHGKGEYIFKISRPTHDLPVIFKTLPRPENKIEYKSTGDRERSGP